MALATLTIDINAKLANIERDLGKIARMSEQSALRMQNAFAGASAAFAALGGGAIVGSLAAFVDASVDAAAAFDDMAEKTGASVESLSALARVAQIGGHDIGIVETATIRLAKALAGADEEAKGAGRAFATLGLDPNKLRAMETSDALKVLADRLAEFKDSGGKTALVMDLLGRSGAQALPYLKDLAETSRLVATVTTEQASAAEKLEKNINRLKVSFGDLARNIALDALPALNAFFSAASAPGSGLYGAALANIDRAMFGVEDYAKRIAELQETLDGLEARKKAPGSVYGGGLMGAMNDMDIGKLRQTIAAYKYLYAEQTLAQYGASYSNEGRHGGIKSLDGYGSKTDDGKKPKVKEFDTRLHGFADNRSAADVMAALHAEDRALESAREKYVAMADPLQKYRDQLEEINRLRSLGATGGGLTENQALEAMWKVNEAMSEEFERMSERAHDTADDMGEFFRSAAQNIQSAMADFLFNPFEQGLDGMLAKFGTTIQRMLAEAAAAQLSSALFGNMGKAGGGQAASWGWAGDALNWLKGAFANADGGVYASPSLHRYANSVVSSPTLFRFANGIGLMGEAGAEAIMPLKRGPDGRLGVQASGGGIVVHQTINMAPGADPAQVRRSAAEGARAVLSAMNGARRYG